jgi:hypothetical protein
MGIQENTGIAPEHQSSNSGARYRAKKYISGIAWLLIGIFGFILSFQFWLRAQRKRAPILGFELYVASLCLLGFSFALIVHAVRLIYLL